MFFVQCHSRPCLFIEFIFWEEYTVYHVVSCPECLDFVVFQEWQGAHLGREPKAHPHSGYCKIVHKSDEGACLKQSRRWKIFGACTTMSVLPATYPQALTTAFSRFVCNCFAHFQCDHDFTPYNATSVTKLTQEGIFPDWEDEKNGSGGRWIINSDRWVPGCDADLSLIDVALPRKQRVDVLDTHWLEILIFMIGEQAEVFHAIENVSWATRVSNNLLYRCMHPRSTGLLWICAPRGTNWGWVSRLEWLLKMGLILEWLAGPMQLFVWFQFHCLKVWLADTSADSVLRVGRQLFCWDEEILKYWESLFCSDDILVLCINCFHRMVKERLGLPKDQTIVFNVHRFVANCCGSLI